MMQKKKNYAAKKIQRAWRRKKLRSLLTRDGRQRYKESRAAILVQRYFRNRQRRRFLQMYRKKDIRRKDHFYHTIEQEEMNEYNNRVNSEAKRFMEADLGKRTHEELEREYIDSFDKYYDRIWENEMIRSRAVKLTHRIDEMFQFFADKPKVG